jgi:hypothetical protein
MSVSRTLSPALLLAFVPFPALLLAGNIAFAAPPAGGDPIPLFAGAARDEAAEGSEALRDLYRWKAADEGSEQVRVYLTPRPAEEAFAFYRDELHAAEGDGGEIDLGALAPGTVTPVAYGKKVEEGKLRWAGFSWVASGSDGAVTGFRIGIEELPDGKGSRIVLWRETLIEAGPR